MVKPCDDRSSAVVPLEHVHGPEWARLVEGDLHLRLDIRREAGLVIAGRKGGDRDVAGEVELGVVLPLRRGEREHVGREPLAEDGIALDDATPDHRPQSFHVHRRIEPEDRVDHHEIFGSVGAQPQGVHRSHRSPPAHVASRRRRSSLRRARGRDPARIEFADSPAINRLPPLGSGHRTGTLEERCPISRSA